MKKIVKYILGITLLLSSSCNTDFLNVQPQDRLSDAAVWGDPALAEAFVNEIYRGLNHGLRDMNVGSMADESQFIHNGRSTQVVQSNLTPGDIGSWDNGQFDEFRWIVLYNRIRQVNTFFENVDRVPFVDPTQKDRLKGEVRFLNAFFYFNLVRLHGGVPIVTRTFALKDDFLIPRNTLAESMEYVVKECNEAAALLPLTHEAKNIGRATKGAALALKSRVLLYAASELFNNPSWATGYAKPELIAYTSGDRNARWQAAKDAAKAVMDLNLYTLHNTGNPVKDYIDIFLTKNNSEAIFSRYFIKSRGWIDGALPGLANGPNGYHNWAGNTPLQELVDDYEMVDGTKFNWSNPVHASAPYENREPRFYASILFDQAKWRPRPADAAKIDPIGKVIIRSVETSPGVWLPGLDTRKGPIEDWNGSYSGYYLRKFIDPNVEHEYAAQGGNQEAPWHFFRLAEMHLNYAEACLGLGQEDLAKEHINKIRDRADLPDITETGQALVDRYRNERRIELSFEQHRYFDVRRWMIAPQALGRNASGIIIAAPIAGPVKYTVSKIQNRAWNTKMYLIPILQEEMNRNKNLVQNPLY